MPPRVLPTVATTMTAPNSEGLALITANTAGSEPSGNKVAEIKLIRKTDVSPTSGAATRRLQIRSLNSIRCSKALHYNEAQAVPGINRAQPQRLTGLAFHRVISVTSIHRVVLSSGLPATAIPLSTYTFQ